MGFLRFDKTKERIIENLSVSAGEAHTVSDSEQGFLNVRNADLITIAVKVQGANASSSGTLTLEFVSSLTVDLPDWDTEPLFTLEVPIQGNSPVKKTFYIDVGEVRALKVLKVKNNDSSYGVTVLYVDASKRYI